MSALIGTFVLSGAAKADYLYNALSVNSWSFVDSQTIMIYNNRRPMAVVKMVTCILNRASSIQILTDNLGPFDGKILVDGEVCEPTAVTKIQ
jgi:hypothetical protein